MKIKSLRKIVSLIGPQEHDGCALWMGTINGLGYGQVKIEKKLYLAHRLVYTLAVGPIPEGLTLDHLCRNRACVNPDHLEPVTAGENVLRGEGPAAQNARKTHCIYGHPLSGENLYLNPGGKRLCRTCRRAEKQRRTQRVREAR